MSLKLNVCSLAAGAALLLFSGSAIAQSSALSSSDQQFAQEASQGNSAEIDLAQLAQKKASSQDVKDFARKLESDHRLAEQKLQQLGSRSGMNLPATPAPSSESAKEQLSKLSGSQFDQAFLKHEIEDHQQDIQKFQGEAHGGQDPELKSYASTVLPQLQDHLRIARELEQKLGPGSGQ